MTSRIQPICMMCRRFNRNATGFTCEAFPTKIPVAIINNAEDHRQPVAGDNGLTFEQDPKMPTLDPGLYDMICNWRSTSPPTS